jgi:hypothetical protein
VASVEENCAQATLKTISKAAQNSVKIANRKIKKVYFF